MDAITCFVSFDKFPLNRLRSISPPSFGRFKLVESLPLSDAISLITRDHMREAVKQHLPVSRPPSTDTNTFPIVSFTLRVYPSTYPPLDLRPVAPLPLHPLFWCSAPPPACPP